MGSAFLCNAAQRKPLANATSSIHPREAGERVETLVNGRVRGANKRAAAFSFTSFYRDWNIANSECCVSSDDFIYAMWRTTRVELGARNLVVKTGDSLAAYVMC